MADALLDSFQAASDRTVAWLLAQQRDDGSLGDQRDDVAFYYKVPLLLLLSGHQRACYRMLDFVADRFQEPHGGFSSTIERKTIDPVLTEYDAYIDGWLAMAAQRAGRFDLARPAWAHLRRYSHPGLGGFCLGGRYRGDGQDVIELLSTAHLGLVALYCGELPLALAAGHCLRRFWERQPDPDRLLLRMDDAGEFIREWPDAAAGLHVVDRRATGQAWFFVGYPIAFLVQLARATGNAAHLATAHLGAAKGFASFLLESGDVLATEHFSHKVGWGMALLARSTGDARYRELALTIGRGMLERQSEAGTWLDEGPEHTRFEQSAEVALWLRKIATLL